MAMHPDLKKWKDLRKKAKRIADTAEHEHSKAYLNASEKYLKDNEGNINYEKLEDNNIQKSFTKDMTDHYLSKAKQHFGANINKNDKMKVDMLMDAYAGVTSTELKRMVKETGKKFTLKLHEAQRGNFVNKIRNKLYDTASGHLTDKHVDDIIKYSKAGHVVDSKKMNIDDAINIHDIYKKDNTISESLIHQGYQDKNTPYRHFLKKDKKKK